MPKGGSFAIDGDSFVMNLPGESTPHIMENADGIQEVWQGKMAENVKNVAKKALPDIEKMKSITIDKINPN